LALFLFRVLAQLAQYLAPVPILPPFEAWHSDTLPYWALLGSQVLIVCSVLWFALGLWRGRVSRNRRIGLALNWAGGFYLIGSIGRFVAGFTIGQDNAFLAAHLPGFFHIVLAAIVLTAAHFHLARSLGERS
jgi:hypothetical protein